MSTFRKLLLAVLLVSLAGSAFGAGTFASFSASTSNAGSTFVTGTLVLSDKVPSAAACLSTGGTITGGIVTGGSTTDSNTNAACNALFTVSTAKPGDPATTVDLTLTNEGNITGATFTGTGGGCTGSNAAGTSFHGSTPSAICTGLKIQVQEYTTSGFTSAVAKCLFPANPSAACAATTGTLTAFGGASLTNFSVAGLAPAAQKFVRVSVSFPDTGVGADNAFQGLQAATSVSWSLLQ